MKYSSLYSPEILVSNGQGKDTKPISQMQVVFLSFYESPKTMLMVSVETGISRANICRYVDRWKRSGLIGVFRENFCKVSKHTAAYYTTNPRLFPLSKLYSDWLGEVIRLSSNVNTKKLVK